MSDISAKSPKKVFIETHGCQMNEYDSSRMVDLLRAHRGMVQVDRAEDADVLLLNTCSIREKAQEKVFPQLGRWNVLKKAKPELKIAVGGCVASQEGAAIGKRAQYVDVVFGPQTLHRLPELLDDVIESMPAMVVNWRSSGLATADAIVLGSAPGSEALTLIVG